MIWHWMNDDLEGRGRDLIEVLSLYFLGRTENRDKNTVDTVEIRTKDLLMEF